MTFTENMDITPPQNQMKRQPHVQKNSADSAESPLEKILKRIRRTDEFPSISKYIMEINRKLSANIDRSNASDVANVILKDYALTNKLLKLVNSAFYGLAAGKVTTVTRAVVVLGFDNIRLATLSLVLFEHFKSKSNISILKELVISSFWAGVLARDIARMGDEVDPEEAFVCAMMSQLGKLLMIYYQPDKYRKISDRILTHGDSETKAAKFACGVTYDELGMAVAKQWNFPPQIGNSMPILTEAELENKKNPPSKLWALTSFVKELQNKIQNETLTQLELENLIKRYQKSVKISKKQLKTLIKDSIEKVAKHASAMHFSIDKSLFLRRLAGTVDPNTVVSERSKDGIGSESFLLTDSEDLKSTITAHIEKSPKDIIMDGIQEISEAMMTDVDVNDVALMSLEVLYRALKFHRALMFAREGNGQQMSARFGYGYSVQRLIGKVSFTAKNDNDLFSLSIKVGKDLIVANAYDPKLSALIPNWYRKHIDAPAFIFLPVLFKNICIGAFYADRDKDGPPISETEHRHLSMLRNQLILAIKYR
jgi:HD-like signal output (HDOD) protein